MAARSMLSMLPRILAAALLVGASTAQAAEIKVIASNAVKEAYLDLVPEFEKATGHHMITIWSGTEAITKRISGGEIVDIVIVPPANIDKLILEGKLVAGNRTDLVKSGVGVAVRSGLPKPDVSTPEAVKQAVLAAKSVAYSSGPSGFHVAGLFEKMGIADRIKAKMTQTPSGVQVGEVVARGEADLGFQQISELLHVKGIDYLGPLPAEIQHITVFSAGLHVGAKEAEAAKALVRFLSAPAAAPIIRKTGMEPG